MTSKATSLRRRQSRIRRRADRALLTKKVGDVASQRMYAEYGRIVGEYYKTGKIPTDEELRAAGFVQLDDFNSNTKSNADILPTDGAG